MNLFHRHEWTLITSSGFGLAIAARKCAYCPNWQTLMFDVSKRERVWVDGNFYEDTDYPVFIIAEEREAFQEAVRQIPPSAEVRSAKRAADLDEMAEYGSPRFFLARDWLETNIAQLDRFRQFLMTRHF